MSNKLLTKNQNTIHCEMCICCKFLNLSDKDYGDCDNIEKLDFSTDNGKCRYFKNR